MWFDCVQTIYKYQPNSKQTAKYLSVIMEYVKCGQLLQAMQNMQIYLKITK